MDGPRRIVVGVAIVDGALGEASRLAIEQARWMAQLASGHVTLVHSSRVDEHWNPRDKTFEADPHSVDTEPLSVEVESLRADGIEVDLVDTESPPGLAVVQQVLRENADLAIVGKRTSRETDGRPLGSVSLKVMRHCPCPVSILKPGSSGGQPKVIVAATDRSAVGEQVVEAAGRLGRRCGSKLHIVHAIQIPVTIQLEGADRVDSFVAEERAGLGKEVDAILERASFTGSTVVHAGVTTPARAVLEAQAHLDADLVVMGTISRGGIPGLLIGNTAERLVGILDCSLVVVKPDDFVCPVAPYSSP